MAKESKRCETCHYCGYGNSACGHIRGSKWCLGLDTGSYYRYRGWTAIKRRPDETYELTITIRNKSKAKLERLMDWISTSMSDWQEEKELPMDGTTWSCILPVKKGRNLTKMRTRKIRSTGVSEVKNV